MISSNFEQLDTGLENIYQKSFSRKMKKLQTLLLVESETISGKYDITKFQVPQLKLDELIALGAMSWYFPEEIKYLIQFWLLENWGGEYLEIRDIILTSKKLCLGYLIIQNRFNDSDFFGNYVRTLSKAVNSDYFNFVTLKQGKVEKYTGYCRGYGETGTWSPHQPEKAIRKHLLTQDEMLELARYRKYLYTLLLELILSKLNE